MNAIVLKRWNEHMRMWLINNGYETRANRFNTDLQVWIPDTDGVHVHCFN